MSATVILSDTLRSPEMRRELPLAMVDPAIYIESGGERKAWVTGFELERVAGFSDLHSVGLEELGLDELTAQGMSHQDAIHKVAIVRACESMGVTDAVVPRSFPLEAAEAMIAAHREASAAHPTTAVAQEAAARAQGIHRLQSGQLGLGRRACCRRRSAGAPADQRRCDPAATGSRIRRARMGHGQSLAAETISGSCGLPCRRPDGGASDSAPRARAPGAQSGKGQRRAGEGRRGGTNVVEPVLEAVRAYASLGEICDIWRRQFGVFEPSNTY